MTETSLPLVVGGYRVGRRLDQGRFLGHALTPSLVELVFLDELSTEQQRIVCSDAQDFSSLPDGGRVAILARTPNNAETPEHGTPMGVRLTTPPDLVESWRQIEEATAATATLPNSAPGETNALLVRVTGLVKRARRGPLILVAIAGVVAVVALLALVPTSPSNTVSDAVSYPASNPFSNNPAGSLPTPTPTSLPAQLSSSTEPLVPLSALGDFILVRLPARSGQGSGEIAVLERSADSWIVRDSYPETPSDP